MTLSTSAVAVCCCSDSRSSLEQPRILDGDDGLGGEVLHQFNLLICEWPHLLAVNDNCADHLVVLNHWDSDQTSRASKLDRGLA